MALNKDCREFLELLNSHGVDYVIIGAQTLAFHGRPRYTGDLDVLIRPTSDNAQRLLGVLTRFGFAQSGFKETDFVEPDFDGMRSAFVARQRAGRLNDRAGWLGA